MSIVAAVPDSPEGVAALAAARQEARLLSTELVVVNVGLTPLDGSSLPDDVPTRIVERSGDQRDPLDVVLDELDRDDVHRLVIGIKRRSPVGKALLGSLSQRLLLAAPVPVLAVKVAEGDEPTDM